MVKATLATHFNARVQMGLYFIWDLTFIILVDECARYCAVSQFADKKPKSLCQAIFRYRVRFFGPMLSIAFDQEGATTVLDV